MNEKKLTKTLVEKLISEIKEEKYVEILIPSDQAKVSFKIKTAPSLSETMLIVNKTVETINSLSQIELMTEIKKVVFYGFLLEALSDLPVPKIKNKITSEEIYDYEKLKNWLNKIQFEEQLKFEFEDNKQFYDIMNDMQNIINEKIEFNKQKIINNTDLIKDTFENINKLILSFQSIPEIIEKFSSGLDGVNGNDIQSLISAFSTLNKDGNLNNLSENIVDAYLNKKGNNDDIDENIMQGVMKEFANVIDLNKDEVLQ